MKILFKPEVTDLKEEVLVHMAICSKTLISLEKLLALCNSYEELRETLDRAFTKILELQKRES